MTRLPEPHERRRRSPAVSPEARAAFLEALAGAYSVTRAAELAGVERRRLYELRDSDEAFAAAWLDSHDAGTDVIRDEIRRRAVEGWDEPLVSAGKVVATVRKFSDRLLELEAKRRDVGYRDRPLDAVVAVGVAAGGVVKVQTGVSLEEVAALMRANDQLGDADGIAELNPPAEQAVVVDVTDEPLPDATDGGE